LGVRGSEWALQSTGTNEASVDVTAAA
jgi:hypothetical protein